jgi:hypothetical protein
MPLVMLMVRLGLRMLPPLKELTALKKLQGMKFPI